MPGRRLVENPPPAASSSDEEMEEEEEEESSMMEEGEEATQDNSVVEQNGSSEEDEEDDGDEKELLGEYPSMLSLLEHEDLTGGAKERAIEMLGNVEKEKLMELEREWRTLIQGKLELFVKEKTLVEKLVKLALDASKSEDQ